MAVKHTFRVGSGKLRTSRINPLQAIQAHCRECMGGSPNAVKMCEAQLCALHPFRFGEDPKPERKVRRKTAENSKQAALPLL